MTVKEYKIIAQLLRKAYAEIEHQAIEEGVSLLSPEYLEARDEIRLMLLKNHGFTLEEYRQVKDEFNTESKTKKVVDEIKQQIEEMFKRHIPDPKEIEAIANSIAEKYVKPPQIINKIVERVTIKEPQIIKETVTEVHKQEYNDNELRSSIKKLENSISNINIPDIEKFRSEINDTWNASLKETINLKWQKEIPDWRKLAMGLEQRISNIETNGSGGLTEEIPVGLINDSNVTFTVTHEPFYINVNGGIYEVGNGIYSSYSSGTITLAAPVGTGGFITSYYQ